MSFQKILGFMFLFLFPAQLVAKPLYMTVRRDFSPKESPQVEINYSATGMIEFRLLRPKNMEKFISSQIDIRRAWRKPPVEDNSARYLMMGLNKTRLDFSWIRHGLDADLRKAHKANLGGGRFYEEKTPLAHGPKKFISTPTDFELVKEFSIYPEKEDAKNPFDVPGFNWWFGSSSSLKTKTIELPPVEPGFYVLQLVQGSVEGQVVLVVNDLIVQMQQTDGSVLLRAANRKGEPFSGVSIKAKDLNGRWFKSGTTNSQGVLQLEGMDKDSLVVAASHTDAGTAIIDSEFFSTTAVYPDLYLYTDRPLYKPNEDIYFRGILRESKNGLSDLLTSWLGRDAKNAEVTLTDVDDKRLVSSKTFPISEFGTFTGNLTVPEDSTGVYRVSASVVEENFDGEFRVKQYVKPIFYLKVESKQESLKAGDIVNAEVTVKRYAGGVPQDVSLGAEIFRTRFQSPEWVEDAGLGEEGSLVTYSWDSKPQVSTSVPLFISRESNIVFDAKGVAKVRIQLPAKLPGEPGYDYKILLKLRAEDKDGNFANSSRSYFNLRSSVTAHARMSAALVTQNQSATLMIRSKSPSGMHAPDVKGKLVWEQRAYGQLSKIVGTVDFKTDQWGKFDVEVPKEFPGRLNAKIILYDQKGNSTTAETTILVAPNEIEKGIIDVHDLTLLSRRSFFQNEELSKTLVLLPENWGKNGTNSGNLYITVAGKKIFGQRVQPVNGLSAWIDQKVAKEYGSKFYVTVSFPHSNFGWIERKISYQVPQLEKWLAVKASPEFPTVESGTEQTVFLEVKDHKGNPVSSEVSVSVVDKAVLALQPEFRPQLMNFFYPSERLNLMSFFSSHFQSYGYGEQMTNLFNSNYSYAAGKSDTQDAKNEEKDTAYFNGQVLTDTSGKAKITFDLPSNQTIWKVIAVAVDKKGRFGEANTEFSANRTISLIAAYPNFMREGDKALVRFSVVKSGETKVKEAKLNFETDNYLAGDTKFDKTIDITSGEASIYSGLTLEKFSEKGRAELKAQVTAAGKTVDYTYSIKTEPNTLRHTEYLKLANSDETGFTLRNSEKIAKASLFVASGFSGAILPSLNWLIRYPFGCVEQLTNSTVPNLVVKTLLEGNSEESKEKELPLKIRAKNYWHRFVGWMKLKLNGKADLSLSESQKNLLKKSSDYAKAGLDRLRNYQNPNGSFGWFPGGQSGGISGDLSMTIFVMLSLLSTDDPSVSDVVDITSALDFIKRKDYSMNTAQKVSSLYIEGRMFKLGNISQVSTQAQIQARLLAEKLLEKGTVYSRSLLLLALKDLRLDQDSNFPKLVYPLLDGIETQINLSIEEKVIKPALWTPLAGNWSDFPGRLASTFAIGAHALHAYGRINDPEKISKKLLSFFNGSHFGSTFETAQVLIHSKWLVEIDKKGLSKLDRPILNLNGKTLENQTVQSLFGGWNLELETREFKAGKNRLKVKANEKLDSSRLVLEKVVPYDDTVSVEHGWKLKKTYYKVDDKSGNISEINNDFKVNVGDLVYVKLDFSRAKGEKLNWWESSYYVLTDQIPAGMSIVEEDRRYETAPYNLYLRTKQPIVRKSFPDRLALFFSFERGWMDREHSFGFILRANFSGEYTSGVTKIEDFYDEQNYGHTGSYRVHIASKPK